MELREVEFWCSNTNHYHMRGKVYNDIRKKWEDGHTILTSRIIKVDAVGADLIVHTRNSEYLIKNYKEELNELALEVIKEL